MLKPPLATILADSRSSLSTNIVNGILVPFIFTSRQFIDSRLSFNATNIIAWTSCLIAIDSPFISGIEVAFSI